MTPALEREAIFPRINGIKKNIAKLRELGALPFTTFSTGDAFDLAQHHLRLALEGVFHIGTHLLSRLPGGRAVQYSEIAMKLGEYGIVDREFAEKKLVPMAKMRNILVHQYADIDPQRLYDLLKNNLGDIEFFLHGVKVVLEHPDRFNLKVD